MFYRHLFIVLLVLFPYFTEAAVTINEIAWMGDSDSPNHEWIELYNSDSEAVGVDGWVLSDGNNLNINLSGNISPQSYAVLERTSDETVVGPAFLIYTGALVNSGVTLTLRNDLGEIVDQVAGGENWQGIGGDNLTKETAQYTTSGWVTDVATPGKNNNQGRREVVNENTGNVISTGSEKSTAIKGESKSKSKSVGLIIDDAELELEVFVPDMVYVNQPVEFLVETSGVGKTIDNSLVFNWNFGDSYQALGREMNHIYTYPGNYVVMVNAAYAGQDVTFRKEVTVLPVKFSITKNDRGDIQINNDSFYEVDISNYSINGLKSVSFPKDTIVLPKSTITIAKERLGGSDNMIAFYDNRRTMLSSIIPDISKTNNVSFAGLIGEESRDMDRVSVGVVTNALKEKQGMLRAVANESKKENFSFSDSVNEIILDESSGHDDIVDSVTNSHNDEFKESKPIQKQNQWPYIVFVLLLLFVSVFIFKGRR